MREEFPGYPGRRALQLPDAAVDSYFLTAFGRPPRVTAADSERQQEPSITQALHVINGDTINRKLRAPAGLIAELAAAGVDNRDGDRAALPGGPEPDADRRGTAARSARRWTRRWRRRRRTRHAGGIAAAPRARGSRVGDSHGHASSCSITDPRTDATVPHALVVRVSAALAAACASRLAPSPCARAPVAARGRLSAGADDPARQLRALPQRGQGQGRAARSDSYEAILAGGEHGSALIPGREHGRAG